MAPKQSLGDILCLLCFLLLLLFFFFLSSAKSFSETFLGDALIKLYETLQEYHMPCEVVPLRFVFFQNGCRCHGNGQNAKKMKNTKIISRLLAKQKLMKLDRKQHPHLVERDKPKQSESVGQTLPQFPWKQKRGDLNKNLIPFIKLHETLQEYPPQCVAAFEGLKKFKMVAIAMVTKVQKMLN